MLYSADVASATGLSEKRVRRFMRENLPRATKIGVITQGQRLAIPRTAFDDICDLCVVADHTARRAESGRRPVQASQPRVSAFVRTGRRWESVEAQQQAWMAGEIGCTYITRDGQRKRLPPKGCR
jgi:hypothetical protein